MLEYRRGLFRDLSVRVCVALGALLLCAASASAAPILSVSPANSNVLVGDTFSVDIVVSDVVDLYAYQFDVTFDPALLQADDILEGAFLGDGGATFFIPGFIDNVLGVVSFTANTLTGAVPGVSGSGTLATLQLTALAPGASGLSLSNVILLDSALGDILDVETRDGNVAVSRAAVPEPGTLWLLLSASPLLYARRRRSRLDGREVRQCP